VTNTMPETKQSHMSAEPYAGLVTMEYDNNAIAKKLISYADLLTQQGSDGFRERAYRRAGNNIGQIKESLVGIVAREGWKGLTALPGIGNSIASVITELIVTGHWAQLDHLKGALSAETAFLSVPGIGSTLASRLVEDYHLETLQQLEAVVRDPRVHIRGIGPRRREAIGAVLSKRLENQRLAMTPGKNEPSVNEILDVDRHYRERARRGELRKIKPRWFNVKQTAWLPVMHERLGRWYFTALFSNTARAHHLGKTNDWVIIYYQADDNAEGRCTVVTETHGPREGLRVVRGREAETTLTVSLANE